MPRWITCVVLGPVCPAVLACAGTGRPEQRIEVLVHDRFARLGASDTGVEYRVGPIRVDAVGEGMYEARFEFDRLARDEAGIPHIARRRQTWLVRDGSHGTAEIVHVDDQKVLAFPGTGPQIVCY